MRGGGGKDRDEWGSSDSLRLALTAELKKKKKGVGVNEQTLSFQSGGTKKEGAVPGQCRLTQCQTGLLGEGGMLLWHLEGGVRAPPEREMRSHVAWGTQQRQGQQESRPR